MFSRESVRVKLKTTADMMNELIDWFGKDLKISQTKKDGWTEVSLVCNKDAMFYWALQYGPYVEVLEPATLRDRLSENITAMAQKYN